jgi:hypothetical protein
MILEWFFYGCGFLIVSGLLGYAAASIIFWMGKRAEVEGAAVGVRRRRSGAVRCTGARGRRLRRYLAISRGVRWMK